jgi:hypothetical protein
LGRDTGGPYRAAPNTGIIALRKPETRGLGESRRFPCAGRQQSGARDGRVFRTLPGSESGACVQRGDSGTWESHLLPCKSAGLGGPADRKALAGLGGFHRVTSWQRTPRTRGAGKGRGNASDKRRVPRQAGWQSLRSRVPRGCGETCRPRRWGTEAQGTRWREGAAGQSVRLGGTMGETSRLPTISTKLQRIAE